jgi:hypothetical protein
VTKTYYKKENKYLWYFILALCTGLIIFGWWLVEYFAWQVMPLIAISIAKTIGISKNPSTPVIELNEDGLQLLTLNNTPLYSFSNISEIHIEDRSFNGYIKLKDSNKKIRLDSVAIPLEDQKEIAALVNQKIA